MQSCIFKSKDSQNLSKKKEPSHTNANRHSLSKVKKFYSFESESANLLANTRHDSYDIEGIRVIDIAQWLLETNTSFRL
ncbi:hypothetical protein BVL65_00925 [Gardnerella swidsinskii]|uniref:Uncharacterized protein n=1 Tax=Gardnerella swidsinskii TaxID=2792979 RepID=A0ABM6GHS5_9BIFI|nr:hypothetical protein BVL65_00925 [Gardnerella vaginalis]RFD73575.1 hypothetical protein AXE72_06235 [Gardnerella vaginalis]